MREGGRKESKEGTGQGGKGKEAGTDLEPSMLLIMLRGGWKRGKGERLNVLTKRKREKGGKKIQKPE